MSNLKLYPKTGIISTLEDLHGEKRSKEDLESFLRALPCRVPVGIQHDMGRVSEGYIENYAVVPIEEHPGEWKLIGDLYHDENIDADETLRGLSFSYSVTTQSNSSTHPDGCVYLPFPQYRDQALNNLVLQAPFPLSVGRWHRKAAEIEPVGIIISFVLFAFSPLWGQFYDQTIRPFVSDLIQRLSQPEFTGVAFDYGQTITLGDDREIRVLLVSDHLDWKVSLEPDRVRQGLEAAFHFLTEHEIGKIKPVDQLRLKYDTASRLYRPVLVHYADGEHLTLA